MLWHERPQWCTICLNSPSGFALVNEIVKKQDLVNANATMNIVFEVGNIVGMGFAGILLQWLGIISLFSIAGGFILFGSIIIGLLRPRECQFHQQSDAHVFKDMADAFIILLKT